MILTNLFCELYRTAQRMDTAYASLLLPRIEACQDEVFGLFRDKEHLIHEFITADGSESDELFCHHINPGHSREDMWFQWEASEILGRDKYFDEIGKIVQKTMALGWDKEYGGLHHFMPADGLDTAFEVGSMKDEPQMKLVLDDRDSKLWWVHSEALYTALLCYFNTGDKDFLAWFERIFDYTFATFPGKNPEVREWLQIRTRDGAPQDKVVALPVKDPFHITRNLVLILELLKSKTEISE